MKDVYKYILLLLLILSLGIMGYIIPRLELDCGVSKITYIEDCKDDGMCMVTLSNGTTIKLLDPALNETIPSNCKWRIL